MRWVLALAAPLSLLLAGCATECAPEASRPDLPAVIVAFDVNATWGPGAVSTGQFTSGPYVWRPSDLDLQAPANQTLVRLHLRLTWNNTPASFGDLAIGLGRGTELHVFQDANGDVQLGAREETLTMDWEEFAGLHIEGLAAGPATDLGYVGPFGLPYSLHVVAKFDEPPAGQCRSAGVDSGNDGGDGVAIPWVSPVLLGLALSTLAFVARHRRLSH